MTFAVSTVSGDNVIVSAVYASNFANDRSLLWNELRRNRDMFVPSTVPWIVFGDFNEILTSSEHSRSRISNFLSLQAFNTLVHDCELNDLRYNGPLFTWWNNRSIDPIGKKLDRTLVNDTWLQTYPSSYTSFEATGISDHVRSVTYLHDTPGTKKTPFRFFNFLTDDETFLPETARIWASQAPLFHSRAALTLLTAKLKSLKPLYRSLNRHRYGSLPLRTKQSFDDLCSAQTAALLQPSTANFEAVEVATSEWHRLAAAEEKFYLQKSRISWLAHGDSNTSFFHNSVRNRTSRNAIRMLTSLQGTLLTTQKEIHCEAINYYSQFLQKIPDANLIDEGFLAQIIRYRCPLTTAAELVAPITGEEIKCVLDHLPSNKATGPDGFTVEFYRAAWKIIGKDVVVAVQSFFHYLFLPRGTNATLLALIPKIDTPATIRDFRPISCCNVIYKIISKLLANRLKKILPEAIEPNQSAFIKGRLLLENVLLATELVTDYHRSSISSRCAVKVDVAKAFDTLRWDFILAVLHTMGLPEIFVVWIERCISTAAFSVSINGETDGFFTSSRGIRQGCSLSPYLFDIANNVLALMLNHAAETGRFAYHPRCDEVRITHLSFADDMLIFTDGTPSSLGGVMSVLKEYEALSGLAINPSKSSIFLGGAGNLETLNWISHNGFQLEVLPIRYLGLPLTTKSMSRSDYEPLIDRIRKRFNSWTNRFLSYGGRLQLIKSVITSITNFWCSVFRLPQRCLDHIESMCAAFLWSGSPDISSKSKVAWVDLCVPKNEGGLGLRRLRDSSVAYSLSLIWRLLTSSGSLWVAWTRHYLLRNSTFWDLKRNTRGSWIWNKLLKLRSLASSFVRHRIVTGKNTYFWLDNWLGEGALIQLVGEVGPSLMGIRRQAKVADVVCGNRWQLRYHRNPLVRAHVLHILSLPPPTENGQADDILWHYGSGVYRDSFSMVKTWQQLRHRGNHKNWAKVIWSRFSIPRYSFIAWLAVLDRLPTGARAAKWGQHRPCIFCGNIEETRSHLFFACSYSSTVWGSLSSRLIGPSIALVWDHALASLINGARSHDVNVLVRFLFQASIYHIWRERNSRIHGQGSKSAATLVRLIISTLTLRLSANFVSPSQREASSLWRLWSSLSNS